MTATRTSPALVAIVLASVCAAQAPPPPPLPRLQIAGKLSVSGISSGADLAPIFMVAHSDKVLGAGAFAGQAYGCATTRFDGEPVTTCAQQSSGSQGPGCVGLESTGPAPCYGCDSNTTVTYDHCKKIPQFIQLDRLRSWAEAAAAAGHIAPLSNLRYSRVYTYRGTKDSVYLPGSVNATGEWFEPYLADYAAQVHFEATIPSQHSQPSVDPNVPIATCGVSSVGGCQNCGYDAVGTMLQHFYNGTLAQPTLTSTDPARLLQFDQDLYGNGTAQYGALAPYGFVYVPVACAGGAAPCRLHIAMHGCGQSATNPGTGLLYVMYSGYAMWADHNNIVILFPQGGGFGARDWHTNASQMNGGCFDGYGETGWDYAFRSGPQVSAIANMARGLGGDAWWGALGT